jgi:hypothetical protein
MRKIPRYIAVTAALLAVLFVVPESILHAGSNTLLSVTGGRVQTSHVNQYFTALGLDFVPRNSSGTPTNIGGSLGSSTYKWLKSFVESGYWRAGDLKMHHTYNGTVVCGEGWMLSDGRVINQANYDTEKGAGHWATYVVSSPLDGKYLPNFTGRYGVGKATTTQDGTVAITTVGNASNQVDISHTHTVANHVHQWLVDQGTSTNNASYNSGGSQTNFTFNTTASGEHIVTLQGAVSRVSGSYYTSLAGGQTSSSSGSSTQSIQPDSVEVQYCMRIID